MFIGIQRIYCKKNVNNKFYNLNEQEFSHHQAKKYKLMSYVVKCPFLMLGTQQIIDV